MSDVERLSMPSFEMTEEQALRVITRLQNGLVGGASWRRRDDGDYYATVDESNSDIRYVYVSPENRLNGDHFIIRYNNRFGVGEETVREDRHLEDLADFVRRKILHLITDIVVPERTFL